MKNLPRIATVLASLAAWTIGCKSDIPESELVAKVNGAPITKAEFEEAVERNMSRYRGQSHRLPPGIEPRIRESVLRRLINEKIIEQKAKELSVRIDPKEIDERFGEHKTRFRTDDAFNDYLKRSGNTIENMKADLERNLLRDAVVEKMSGAVEVTGEEVAKYYEDNKDRFKEREQVKASRILVRVAPNATEADKKAAQKKAAELRGKAASQDADFGALAKEHSQAPEAGKNGELGWLPTGRMTAEFDRAAFALEPGQVSDVVETRLGYEIIKVWEKRAEEQRSLEAVEESIRNSLTARKRNEKRREVLRELKNAAKVDTFIEFEKEPVRPPAMQPPGAAHRRPGEATPGEGAGHGHDHGSDDSHAGHVH